MDQQVVLTSMIVTDLVAEIARAVRVELDARAQVAQSPPEELLTRQQAAELLGITLPTLREYTRQGYLTGYRLGTRVRYRRNELVDGLQRMRYAKTARP